MSTAILWLIAGAVFVATEMFVVPGVGFLFAGIGAIIVGTAIELGLLDIANTIVQFILFFIISCASAALLWKKLKRTRTPNYHNMVGTEATVAAPGLSGRNEGQVKWSGTLLRARISEGADIDVMPEGTPVTIRKVEGNLVYVAPKTR